MAYRQLTIASIQSSSPDDGSNPASQSIDGNLSTRYSSPGVGAQITYDLGQSFDVQDLDVAWYRGDERRVAFRVRTSENLSTWTDVFLGESSGTTTNYEKFNCINNVGRYVRLVFEGGSQTEWFSISEVRINGDDPPSALDAFGIAKIYSDSVSNPHVKYMDMANARTLPLDTFPATFSETSNQVGTINGQPVYSWLVAADQVRLTLWSDDNKPWGNVEDTFYVKLSNGPTGSSSRLFQPYIGGGDHSNNNPNRCDGNAYKFCVFGDGHTSHRKEICHEAYCSDRNALAASIQNMPNNTPQNRWYGFKIVQILLPNGGGTRIEAWIDEGADSSGNLVVSGNASRWRKLSTYDDVRTGTLNGVPYGTWTCSDTEFDDCENCDASGSQGGMLHPGFVRIQPYAVTRASRSHSGVTHTNAAAVTLRTDGTTAFELAFWSAREIQSPVE